MSFKVKTTPEFERSVKKIAKKHKSIRKDISELINQLEQEPRLGIQLGNNLYKIRLGISGSSKDKSGGVRVITYVKFLKSTVILTDIYLKSEFDTVDEAVIIKRLIAGNLI